MFKVGDHGEVPAPEVYWMTDFDKWVRLCFYAFLISSGDGYVLVNTGLTKDLHKSNEFLKQFAKSDRCKFTVKEEEKIENILKRNNLVPEDIAHVVITPVQDYTIGGINLFKKAKIYFSRKGWYEDMLNPKPPPFVIRDLILPDYVRNYLFEEAWTRIELVENQELLDGLEVKWTGGHHRSSMAVIVKSNKKTVALTDAAFTHRNLEEDLPIGIAENIYECLSAYDYLKRTCDIVIPAYDPGNLEAHGENLL